MKAFETRMHSIRMRTARSLPYKGGFSVRGCLFRGYLSRGPLSRGGLCQGALCPGGALSKGFLSREVSVRETPSPVDRQMPVKILPCPKLRLQVVNIIIPFIDHLLTMALDFR